MEERELECTPWSSEHAVLHSLQRSMSLDLRGVISMSCYIFEEYGDHKVVHSLQSGLIIDSAALYVTITRIS